VNIPAEKKQSTASVWIDPRGGGLSLIDALFNRFDGMYPNRWRAAFANAQAIANWREAWVGAFVDEALSPDDVARGVRACRRAYDWPPSLTEFLKMCRVSVDPESAYVEAVRQMAAREVGGDVWSHPAIFWAAVEFGTWDLRNASAYDRVRARWSRILAQKLMGSCPPVPVAALALPAPGETTPDAEQVLKILAGARSILKNQPRVNA